jgi:hypothetical protein
VPLSLFFSTLKSPQPLFDPLFPQIRWFDKSCHNIELTAVIIDSPYPY